MKKRLAPILLFLLSHPTFPMQWSELYVDDESEIQWLEVTGLPSLPEAKAQKVPDYICSSSLISQPHLKSQVNYTTGTSFFNTYQSDVWMLPDGSYAVLGKPNNRKDTVYLDLACFRGRIIVITDFNTREQKEYSVEKYVTICHTSGCLSYLLQLAKRPPSR
ncbi:hypothetical protein [Endozoicomonas sp. Mp262]|uniref:hypothetical protein n=1 Tax=Endozoicomonas sp. Mp262 TaxID=2919499 RepID=UPI0021D956C1